MRAFPRAAAEEVKRVRRTGTDRLGTTRCRGPLLCPKSLAAISPVVDRADGGTRRSEATGSRGDEFFDREPSPDDGFFLPSNPAAAQDSHRTRSLSL